MRKAFDKRIFSKMFTYIKIHTYTYSLTVYSNRRVKAAQTTIAHSRKFSIA